jgi:hypothetical protein
VDGQEPGVIEIWQVRGTDCHYRSVAPKGDCGARSGFRARDGEITAVRPVVAPNDDEELSRGTDGEEIAMVKAFPLSDFHFETKRPLCGAEVESAVLQLASPMSHGADQRAD